MVQGAFFSAAVKNEKNTDICSLPDQITRRGLFRARDKSLFVSLSS